MASTRDVSDIIQRCIKILTDKGFTTSITTENLTEQKRLTIDIVKTDTNEPAATITACASTCEIQERHHTHDTRSPKLNMEINSINVNWVNSLIPKQQLGQLSIILAVLILAIPYIVKSDLTVEFPYNIVFPVTNKLLSLSIAFNFVES